MAAVKVSSSDEKLEDLQIGEKGSGHQIAPTFTHHNPDWDGTGVDFSQVDEARTLRKMDLRLIPALAVLYLLSFLDRGM